MSRINDIKYLKAYYKLNGEVDSSGFHVDRVGANNAVLDTGPISYRDNLLGKTCMVFDASSGADSLTPDIVLDPNNITISCKIVADSLVSGDRSFISKRNQAGTQDVLKFGVTNTGFLFFKGNGATIGATDNTTEILTGKEYNVAGSFDGTTWRLYINGSKVFSVNDAGTITNDDIGWIIGSDLALSTSSGWTGSIGDLRIYNVALSDSEISELNSTMNLTTRTNPGSRSTLVACVQTRTDYIDTLVQLDDRETTFEMDFIADADFSGSSSPQYIAGYYSGNNERDYFRKSGSTLTSTFNGYGLNVGNYTWSAGRRFKITQGVIGFENNSNRAFSNYTANLVASTNTIKIFNVTGNSAKFWLISFKIIKSGVVVAEFYPTENGQLFDVINQVTVGTNSGDPLIVRREDVFVRPDTIEKCCLHIGVSSYIDSGHIPTPNTTWEVDCRFFSLGSSFAPIGCYDSSNSSGYGHFSMGTRADGQAYVGYSNHTADAIGVVGDYGRHIWKLVGGDGLYIDGELKYDISSIPGFVAGNKTIHINNTVTDNDKPGIEIYRSTIWENGEMIQNLIPYEGEGMWDTVTETVFSDSAVGSSYAFHVDREKHNQVVSMRHNVYTETNNPIIGGDCFNFVNANASVDYGTIYYIAMMELEIKVPNTSNVPLVRNSAGSYAVNVSSGSITFSGVSGFAFVNGVEGGTLEADKWNHIVIYFKRTLNWSTLKLGRNASIGWDFCCRKFNCFDSVFNKDEAESFAIGRYENARKAW